MLNRLRYGCLLIAEITLFLLTIGALMAGEPDVWGPRIGSWFAAPTSFPNSDAIIVLGGNTTKRAETGLVLYQARLAPHLYITGHNPDDVEDWEAQRIRDHLVAEGVPEQAIGWVETTSTREDAEWIANQARLSHWHQILVVSDWVHGRRALCAINTTLDDPGVGVTFVPAVLDYGPNDWWHSEDGLVAVFSESIKLLYYGVDYGFPLGGCWSGGMNPARLLLLWGAGIPLSLLLVVAMWQYTLRRKVLDIPNERSSHSDPMPLGGGISIASVTLGLFLVGVWHRTDIARTEALAFLLISTIIAVIGLVDDWWLILSAKTRLLVHIGAAIALVALSGTITEVFIPWLGTLHLGLILGAAVTLLWLIGLTNVYNFMDGIDGLAGTQAFLAGSAWALLFLLEGQETLALLGGLIAASSLGFLMLNAPPAKIFMGDVGSTFLGFSFSALTVIAFKEMGNPRLLATGALFVGVFIFDAALTLLRRARNRENLLEAHHSHLYQRLITLGYSHRTVCIRYSYLMMASIIMGFVYYYAGSNGFALGALGAILAVYLGLALDVTWLESSHTKQSSPMETTQHHS